MRLPGLIMAVAWMAASTSAAPGDDILLLTGFEKEDAVKLGAKPDGEELVWQESQYRTYRFRKADVTQGEYAYVAERGPQYLKTGDAPYPIMCPQGGVFHTFGRFEKLFPRDWSGYERFRVDVKSNTAAGRIRLELEDDICQPLLRRTYSLPAGQWVTLEFDLSKAAAVHEIRLPGNKVVRGRTFNPARMANIYIYLEQLDDKSEILLDNIRLLKAGAGDGSRLPVLRDDRPFFTPVALATGEPKPRPAPEGFKPVRGPVTTQPARTLDAPRLGNTGYARVGPITCRAFAAADRDHMLLGFLAGYMHVLQTADGGASWRGLDGADKPTRCYHDANAPSHAAVADRADMLYVHTARCGGGSTPAKMFFRRLAFDGKGWQLGPPRLVDLDCRHCPEFQVRVLALPSGRIWAVWMHHDRHNKLWLRGRFSDDDGLTWRDPDSNAMLVVDQDNSAGPQQYGVTLWPVDAGGATTQPDDPRALGKIDDYYPHGSFELTRWGDSLACLYTRTWHPKAYWTTFDGTRWTEPKFIGDGFPRSAVTVGERTIYVAMRDARGQVKVLRLDGQQWVDDTPPGGQGGLLSVSGSRVFCLWTSQDGQKFTLNYAAKPDGGRWTEPAKLAEETLTDPKATLGVAAPQFGPDNFVPVAWGPPNGWIKWVCLSVNRGSPPD